MKTAHVVAASLLFICCSRTTVEAQDALVVAGSASIGGPAEIDNATVGEGDFRGSALNGVINCGGVYRNYTNALADTVSPNINFAVGDEDLFIEDTLEVVGSAYKTGGGSWTSLSDERLKKNIEPFTDGLEQILSIRPVLFQYNELSRIEDQETRHIGVLAQEMLPIAPYMVREEAIGKVVREIENGVDEILDPGDLVYVFDPSAFDYLLINALQQQQKLIEALTARIEALEK